MRDKLVARMESGSGVPLARVPAAAVWELVEYLSWQRERVRYSYEGDCFIVWFLNCDHAAAQRLLDDWAAAPMELAAHYEEGPENAPAWFGGHQRRPAPALQRSTTG